MVLERQGWHLLAWVVLGAAPWGAAGALPGGAAWGLDAATWVALSWLLAGLSQAWVARRTEEPDLRVICGATPAPAPAPTTEGGPA